MRTVTVGQTQPTNKQDLNHPTFLEREQNTGHGWPKTPFPSATSSSQTGGSSNKSISALTEQATARYISAHQLALVYEYFTEGKGGGVLVLERVSVHPSQIHCDIAGLRRVGSSGPYGTTGARHFAYRWQGLVHKVWSAYGAMLPPWGIRDLYP
ncbi:hypothetical protein C7212DRAFT_340692 [Tuber magnatum]|uniref:Uncharacterized protein n=1 Tax=Tuber magnatum TaxID=42249 RepID=A0A317T0M5_9PEZI|nr:hypothetical protein C7212DRAFT_340692 [Tuber magnatum]